MQSVATTYPEQDIFLWLKRPAVAQMRVILKWAHRHALREDIRCEDVAEFEKYTPADFKNIVDYIDSEAKVFFRVIVRKGLNRLMSWDSKKESDILDIGIRRVKVEGKFYSINLYLSAGLLEQLKHKFSLEENVYPKNELKRFRL